MLQLFLRGGASNQEIVDVYIAERQSAEHLIHKPLKHLRCIPKAEGHPKKFKEAKRCHDSSLWNVFWWHRGLVIRPDEVYVGKDSSSLEYRSEVVEVGDRGTMTLLRARHGRQSPGVCLGTICSGDDQLLSEGRIITNCSMWSNSCCAILNRSGANLRVCVGCGCDVMQYCMLHRAILG